MKVRIVRPESENPTIVFCFVTAQVQKASYKPGRWHCLPRAVVKRASQQSDSVDMLLGGNYFCPPFFISISFFIAPQAFPPPAVVNRCLWTQTAICPSPLGQINRETQSETERWKRNLGGVLVSWQAGRWMPLLWCMHRFCGRWRFRGIYRGSFSRECGVCSSGGGGLGRRRDCDRSSGSGGGNGQERRHSLREERRQLGWKHGGQWRQGGQAWDVEGREGWQRWD